MSYEGPDCSAEKYKNAQCYFAVAEYTAQAEEFAVWEVDPILLVRFSLGR